MKSKFIVFILILFLPILYLFTDVSSVLAGCDNAKPGEPVITSAVASDKSVTLTWTEPAENVTYYLIQYGLSKDAMAWGLPNIGGKGTTSFTINDLENGQKYYFQIRAGNGCEPGSFSNTLDAQAGLTQAKQFKTPNLSILKSVLGEATQEAKHITKGPAIVAAAIEPSLPHCTIFCSSWILLATEIVALLGFFFLAHRFHSIKPFFSILIPASTIFIYYQLDAMCYLNNFFCQYFISFSITIYLLVLVPQKFSLLSKHSDSQKITTN